MWANTTSLIKCGTSKIDIPTSGFLFSGITPHFTAPLCMLVPFPDYDAKVRQIKTSSHTLIRSKASKTVESVQRRLMMWKA